MSIISFNALSSYKLERRLKVLLNGGIINKNHEVRVRLPSEGPKPSLLPSNWEWIDWSKHLRGERHIRLPAQGMLDLEADYTIFCDDDSLTNIDHLVKILDSYNDKTTPTIWFADPGRFFPKEWERSFRQYVGDLMPNKNITSMFLGYEISIINQPLAKLLNGSEAAKRILKYCDFLDQRVTGVYSTPDLQISMASWLVGARQIGGVQSRCQQWPNYFNYSGINPHGSLCHIHWIDHGKYVKIEDVGKLLKMCPTDDFDLIFSTIYFNAKRGFKAKTLFDKYFTPAAYHAYWHAGEMDPYPNGMPKILIQKNGEVRSIENKTNSSKPWGEWQSIKDGMMIITPHSKIYLKWTHGDMIVGYELSYSSKAAVSTIALMPLK